VSQDNSADAAPDTALDAGDLCSDWANWTCVDNPPSCAGASCSATCPADTPLFNVYCSGTGQCTCQDSVSGSSYQIVITTSGTTCDICSQAFQVHGCGRPGQVSDGG
jgi:hypothetical protein